MEKLKEYFLIFKNIKLNIMGKIKLIIIIGLPGSGKSFLMNKLNDYILFDDFIDYFFNGKLIENIKSNNKVCISDPRLCIPEIFDRYMKKILKYVSKSNIFIIIFENNPRQCLINIQHTKQKKRNIENTIIQYSKYYDINHYKNFKHMIIPVYCGE